MTNSASSDRPTNSDRAARFERSAQFWMRAYPLRWRTTFGANLLSVLHDVTAPGAKRVPAREAVGIVRAGWALRWREHPPLKNWLAYRFIGIRLPARYRFWAMDDVLGPLYTLRANWFALPILVGSAPNFVQSLSVSDPIYLDWIAWSLPFLLVFILLFLQRVTRRSAWRHHFGSGPPPQLLSRRAQRKSNGASHG